MASLSSGNDNWRVFRILSKDWNLTDDERQGLAGINPPLPQTEKGLLIGDISNYQQDRLELLVKIAGNMTVIAPPEGAAVWVRSPLVEEGLPGATPLAILSDRKYMSPDDKMLPTLTATVGRLARAVVDAKQKKTPHLQAVRTKAVWHAFLGLGKAWKLSDFERSRLLQVSEGSLKDMDKTPPTHLTEEAMERVGTMLSIYKSLYLTWGESPATMERVLRSSRRDLGQRTLMHLMLESKSQMTLAAGVCATDATNIGASLDPYTSKRILHGLLSSVTNPYARTPAPLPKVQMTAPPPPPIA